MTTVDKNKSFDCIKMKNDIQDAILEETKKMSDSEVIKYFNKNQFLKLDRTEQFPRSLNKKRA